MGSEPTLGESRQPDTLDLPERAELALHGLTHMLDPEARHELYPFAWIACKTPVMLHYKNSVDLVPKLVEALPLLRHMSGSTQWQDVDRMIMEGILDDLGEDGLYYARCLPERPWHEGGMYHACEARGEDFSSLIGDARLLLAFTDWHARDGEDRWKRAAERLAKALCRIAIRKDDYAYYPDGGIGMAFCIGRNGWYDDREPTSDNWGGEGTVMCYTGTVIRALSRYAAWAGDEEALETARRLVRYVMMPRMWGTERKDYTDYEALRRDGKYVTPGFVEITNDPHHLTAGAERAHFIGHFHGKLAGLRGLLEYAVIAGDGRLKEFVRNGYEFARHRGIPRIGCFGDHNWLGVTEGCTVADMLALAMRLTDAGLGDFREDAERIVRNHLVEQQLTSREALDAVAGRDHPNNTWGPWQKEMMKAVTDPRQTQTKDVTDRLVGLWANFAGPDVIPYPYITMCCPSNCAHALYAAWEFALRETDGRVRLNLLLNRRSPAADVESSLPHEGKVVVRNRSASGLSIRVPPWVNRQQLRWFVSPEERPAFLNGSDLVLPTLAPRDVVTVTFPIREDTTRHTMPFSGTYDLTFRGNTCVAVSPRIDNPGCIPIYRRKHLRTDQTPMKAGRQFLQQAPPLPW